MKFEKSYDGTQKFYRKSYSLFVKPFNYLSPNYEYLLRSKYVKKPYYNPVVKRLNTIEISGVTPKIENN
jgi:hypothetical protein